jgi:hypothetical protein
MGHLRRRRLHLGHDRVPAFCSSSHRPTVRSRSRGCPPRRKRGYEALRSVRSRQRRHDRAPLRNKRLRRSRR